jgi:hypothetical protein
MLQTRVFNKVLWAQAALAALLFSAPLLASDIVYPGGGTLAQIVDGGGTNTIITLVNQQSATNGSITTNAAPYTLYFYNDNGLPLSLSTTAGTGFSISGTLPAGGATIIQTNGGGPTVVEGYAVLVTAQFAESATTGVVQALGNQIAGSAVFTIPLASGVLASASCPLDTSQDYIITLPFDETGDATSAQTGVAIANSLAPIDQASQHSGTGGFAYIHVAFYDQNGNPIPIPAGQSNTILLANGAHTSFLLDQQYPQIIGQQGTVVFTGTDSVNPYIIKVLGLRATANSFTSITPIIPCNLYVYPAGTQYAGQSGGCQN